MESEELKEKLTHRVRSEDKVKRRRTGLLTKGLVFMIGLGLTAPFTNATPQNINWTHALVSPSMQRTYTWLEEWAYPTNPAVGKFIPIEDPVLRSPRQEYKNIFGIRETNLYEIILPKGASLNAWMEHEDFRYGEITYNFRTHPEVYPTTLNWLNRKRHSEFDPKKQGDWQEGRKIVIADLNGDKRIFGIDLDVYMEQGKARHISIDAINEVNSALVVYKKISVPKKQPEIKQPEIKK